MLATATTASTRAPRAASRTSSTSAPAPQMTLRITTGSAREVKPSRVARIRAEDEDAAGGDDRRGHGGGHGPAAEVGGHLEVLSAGRPRWGRRADR